MAHFDPHFVHPSTGSSYSFKAVQMRLMGAGGIGIGVGTIGVGVGGKTV